MYAKQDFKTPAKDYKAGDKVEASESALKLWLDAGLVSEEKPNKTAGIETKPMTRKGKERK